MKATSTTPNVARGEVLITIAGTQYPVRFGMNVMKDFSKLTGKAPSELGVALSENPDNTLGSLVLLAIRRYVPGQAEIAEEVVYDLIDGLSAEEIDAITEAITEAVAVGNPLLLPLSAKVAARGKAAAESIASENGTSSSTSLSAN
jgi:hypothetical protein